MIPRGYRGASRLFLDDNVVRGSTSPPMKVCMLMAGWIGLFAVGCASAPMTPARVAQASAAESSDANPDAPAEEAREEASSEPKTDEAAAPLPTTCSAEGTLKDT